MKIPIDPLKFIPLVSWIYRLWTRTIRFEVHGDWKLLLDANVSGDAFVAALWHGELFPVVGFANRIGGNYAAVVSQSKDGEFAAKLLESFGHKTVRGSSSKGGVKALLQLKRYMDKENRIGVFAVDGPRGPRHKPKDGVIFVAQRAGAKIVPIRAYPKWKKVFGSWDRFVLPVPFSKCPIYIGEPMTVTDEKLEKDVMATERKRLEVRLNSLGVENQE